MVSKKVIFSLLFVCALLVSVFFFSNSQKTRKDINELTDGLDLSTISSADLNLEDPVSSAQASENQTNIISISDSNFSPKAITIKTGESVIFLNQDTIDHQINSSPHPQHTDYPPLNTIGLLKPGEQSQPLTFNEKGIYKYHDHLNPQLFGTITVE